MIDCSDVLIYDSQESFVLGRFSNTTGTRILTKRGNTSEITPLRVQFAHAEIVEGTRDGVFNPGDTERANPRRSSSAEGVTGMSAVARVIYAHMRMCHSR